MSEFAHCNGEMVARAIYLVEILLEMTTLLSSVLEWCDISRCYAR